MFDQPLLLRRETLKLKPAFQERLILHYRFQVQPPAKVGQAEIQVYRIAGLHFSRQHEAEAALAKGDRPSGNRFRDARV